MVRESPELMEIYFLDVGQGDCTVIVLPDDSAIVFDVGDQRVLERFMANHRLGIRAVIASHLDIDHVVGCSDFCGVDSRQENRSIACTSGSIDGCSRTATKLCAHW